MKIPSHKNRTAQEIVSENIYHDTSGYAYRAVSWLDLTKRSGDFAAFHYTCIDARLAIEYLIFDLLVVSAGTALERGGYQLCLSDPRKLDKLLQRLVPDYDLLQEFNTIILSITPGAPNSNRWDIKELRKSWGRISRYLHWTGAYSETTENTEWQQAAIEEVESIINPLWVKICSGLTGSIRIESMPDPVREIWEEFKNKKIDSDSARFRLELIRKKKRYIPVPVQYKP